MSMWKSSLFSCFDDLRLCIITYIVPCYTFGKNAEAMGENCLCCAVTYMLPIVQFVAAVRIRGHVRTMKSIPGSTCRDFVIILFCPFCALIQEANEVRGDYLLSQSIARE